MAAKRRIDKDDLFALLSEFGGSMARSPDRGHSFAVHDMFAGSFRPGEYVEELVVDEESFSSGFNVV